MSEGKLASKVCRNQAREVEKHGMNYAIVLDR